MRSSNRRGDNAQLAFIGLIQVVVVGEAHQQRVTLM